MKVIRDKDGDIWLETHHGQFVCVDEQSVQVLMEQEDTDDYPLEVITTRFGPVTEI